MRIPFSPCRNRCHSRRSVVSAVVIPGFHVGPTGRNAVPSAGRRTGIGNALLLSSFNEHPTKQKRERRSRSRRNVAQQVQQQVQQLTMAGWAKLFSSIVTSSIWCEDHA